MPKSAKFKDTLYNPEYLRQKYEIEGMNASELARLIGCTPGAILDNLKKHGIECKTMSEVVKALPHPGSNAPRIKASLLVKYKDTVYDDAWLRSRYEAGWNASEIAQEAGCSVPMVQENLKDLGLTPLGISEAKSGRPNLKVRVENRATGADMCRTSSHRIANATCLPGNCVVCGGPGEHVNHMNRNWRDNRSANLERLCKTCHVWQHRAEEHILLQECNERGEFERIRRTARELILSGEWAPAPHRSPGAITLDGKTMSIGDWSSATGLKSETIRNRLAAGWDPEKVLTTPVQVKAEEFFWGGVLGTLADHARRKGIPVGNVYSRISQGWDRDRALSTPIRDPGWKETALRGVQNPSTEPK